MSTNSFVKTIVIGGGQAGLAAGYFLTRQGQDFLILDENERSGAAWRRRWDSLRLFTPARFDGLPGMPFPGEAFSFPTKDEVAAYLENYAQHFKLPVRHGFKVQELIQTEQGYRITTGDASFEAQNVIVATGPYQSPSLPAFAEQLDPSIFQLHSAQYHNPSQIPVQNILVVGAGNSGAEISLDLARAGKKVWLAGRDVGRIPADVLGRAFGGRPYWWFISRVLSVDTPVGRRMRNNILHHGAPLIGSSREDIRKAGVVSLPRINAVVSGHPQAGDTSLPVVEAVIWATGFRPNFDWIKLPVFEDTGYPRHERGLVPQAPGLLFLGLPFQTSLSSALLGGIGVEAEHITHHLASEPRQAPSQKTAARQSTG